MRALAICLATGLAAYQLWTPAHTIWRGFVPAADPHAQPAIALRCAEEAPAVRAECAQELRDAFEAGTQVPEQIVRRHCTRFANGWASDAEAPADVCLEMYGGWIEG